MFGTSLLPGRDSSLLFCEETTPLERAAKFAKSKLTLQRLVVARTFVETAHCVGYEDSVVHLFPLVRVLIKDSEADVRCSVLFNLGGLTAFLIQGDPDKGYQLVLLEILPLIRNVLSHDESLVVRRAACDSLVVVTPHIRPSDRSTVVLPIVLGLAHDPDDSLCRCLAVSLLSGLAESFGIDLCEQFIVPQLCCLSEDPSIEVRSAAALSFVQICEIVRNEVIQMKLIPSFLRLTYDHDWSVRRACLEVIAEITEILSADVVYGIAADLSSAIRRLLSDEHRLVKVSAQRALGPFLASLTFPYLIPRDLVEEYLALASLESDGVKLSASDRALTTTDLIAYHSAASMFDRMTVSTASRPVAIVGDGNDAPNGGDASQAMGTFDPASLCAHSLAAVLWAVCGKGPELFRIKRRRQRSQAFSFTNESRGSCPPIVCRYRESSASFSPSMLSDGIEGQTAQYRKRSDHSGCCRLGSASAGTSPRSIPAGDNEITGSGTWLGGFETCAMLGGREYWWPAFRPALLTLLNKHGGEAAVNIQIRKSIAASFPYISSLVLEGLEIGAESACSNGSATTCQKLVGHSADSLSSALSSSSLGPVRRGRLGFSVDAGDPFCSVTQTLSSGLKVGGSASDMASPEPFCAVTEDVEPSASMISDDVVASPLDNSSISAGTGSETLSFPELNVDGISLCDEVSTTENGTLDCSLSTSEQCITEEPSVALVKANTSVQSCQAPPSDASTAILEANGPIRSEHFKAKRERGTRSRPGDLEDVEAICDTLLRDHVPSIRTAMMANLAEVLRCCPAKSRHAYLVKLGRILQENSPCPETTADEGSEGGDVSHLPLQLSRLISRLGLLFPGGRAPTADTSRRGTDNNCTGSLRDCWRLRHAAASQLPIFFHLVEDPQHGLDIVFPVFLQLACDPVAVVRRTACASAGLLCSFLCPVLTFYFQHGGSVDCTFQSRSLLETIHSNASKLMISNDLFQSLSLSLKASLMPLLHLLPEGQWQMSPPSFLKEGEVTVVKTLISAFALSEHYQQRISFIRMCDVILRQCPIGFFQLYFLRPLVRLSADPVKNVRCLWASTMRAHVHRHGRLGDNALVVTAAGSLLSSSNQQALSFDLTDNQARRRRGLKRTSSASSVETLTGDPHRGVRHRTPSSTSRSSTLSPRGLSPAPPIDSVFVGTDAEIRRHLGSIVLASDSETVWNDGLDVDDLLDGPASEGIRSTSSISAPSSQPAPQQPSVKSTLLEARPRSLSIGSFHRTFASALTSTASARSNSDELLLRPPVSPEHVDSPCPVQRHSRQKFLLAHPRGWTQDPSAGSFPGLHVDELDLPASASHSR